jgi:hypothetical protein
VNALTGAGTNNANAQSSNNNSAATASGNAGLVSAGQINGLIGNAFNAYGATRGASSFGGGGSASNIDTSGLTSMLQPNAFSGIPPATLTG